MERHAFNHLCMLARLELAPAELAEFEAKFERLLQFVEQVQNYTPVTQGPPMTLSDRVDLRLDSTAPFDWPDDYTHDYKVPAIIDFEGGG
jgi:Asp-tRNA(Asn)/Glu-tRNA(Gln) amidotransferase C subunit